MVALAVLVVAGGALTWRHARAPMHSAPLPRSRAFLSGLRNRLAALDVLSDTLHEGAVFEDHQMRGKDQAHGFGELVCNSRLQVFDLSGRLLHRPPEIGESQVGP